MMAAMITAGHGPGSLETRFSRRHAHPGIQTRISLTSPGSGAAYTIRNSSGLPSSVSLTGLPMLLRYSFW
jgi:hypothetical protein